MKVDGSLASLVQGVSQQSPNQRRPGQHGEQINMLADPVRGLSRRHGSIWQTELDLALDSAKAAANVTDSASFRSFDYTSGGRDLTVLYRSAAQAAGSDMPPVMVYDKTNGQFLTVVRNGSDALLDTLSSGGVSAITAVGKYVFLGGNTIVPAATNTDVWGDATNQALTVLWVRGGAYARTYKATVTKTDNSQVSFEYTTPQASYPGTLDTSGVQPYTPDVTGASTSSQPDTAVAYQYAIPTPGTTLALSFTPSGPLFVSIAYGGDNGGDTLFLNVDYTLSGTTLTWLNTSLTANITLQGLQVTVLYQHQPGGSSTQTLYATEETTETVYVKSRDGFGIGELAYGMWAPTGMTVKNGVTVLTNVFPAQPANPGEYSWETGGKEIIFDESLARNPYITAKYTHTKVVANPHYSRIVTDLTSEFNAAVTNWLGTAAKAIQPENIAESLKTAAIAAGLTGVTRYNATVVFTAIKDITFSDSGDGTLLKGLANKAQAVDDLTDAHYVGKVVRVSPTGQEAFYMKATAKNPSITSGVTDVTWVEGAGISRVINSALCYGVADSTSFYMAGSAALLNAILPGDHPTYADATVGDDDTSPLPHFVGRKISYLGVFQDRLLVGSNAVLRASKTGDYLNFFRSSVLTVPADDPFEMLSQGSEDDTLRFSVLYDRDLILFGKRQYAVSGRAAMTPTSANMPVMSSHEGADDSQPRAAGGIIFYAKRGQSSTSAHQIEPGRNDESPESYPASSQLDDYMTGDPVELTIMPKPSTLFVRTSGARNTLFVFSYLDSQEKRLQDCWHRWDYNAALGPIIGTTVVREGLLVFTLRQGNNVSGTFKQWIVCDLQPMDGQLSDRPYLDSNRLYDDIVASPGSAHVNVGDSVFRVAFDHSTSERLIGGNFTEAADLQTEFPSGTLVAGATYVSSWTPTNPVVRDNENRSINTGRLVVTSLLLAFRDSSGFSSDVTAFEATTTFDFNGRLLGDVNNVVGEVPVTTAEQSVVIGREASEYTQVISAHTWLPLNLIAVDWTGQLFHRPQRVG